jgi:uncharacterized membrane protein YphA (DoxX/SURF4 family)
MRDQETFRQLGDSATKLIVGLTVAASVLAALVGLVGVGSLPAALVLGVIALIVVGGVAIFASYFIAARRAGYGVARAVLVSLKGLVTWFFDFFP